MSKHLTPLHSLLLAAFLALALLGSQALKDSPWHDHSGHVQDCALCHLQLADAALPSQPPLAPIVPAEGAWAQAHSSPATSAPYALYQGRAPPILL